MDHIKAAYHTKILRRVMDETKTKEYKTILHDINLSFNPGELVAIIGGSGCGKTTMLSLIAGRLRSGWVRGKVNLQGKPVGAWSKRIIGYVAQEDTLHPLDTPAEVIEFSARCSRGGWNHKKVVDDLIAKLGLETCRNTKIGGADALDAGGTAKVGLSGGEKRRLSVARELARPNTSLLLLDECTSGLDVRNAEKLIYTLKTLTQQQPDNAENSQRLGVITTIHQPSSFMWSLFDRIVLMDSGHVIYDAAPKDFHQHMNQIGISLPASTNPADFLVSMIKDEEKGEEFKEKLKMLTLQAKILKAAKIQNKYWNNEQNVKQIKILPVKSLSIDIVNNLKNQENQNNMSNENNDNITVIKNQEHENAMQYVEIPRYNTHYGYENNNIPQSGFVVKQKQNIIDSSISASLVDNNSLEANSNTISLKQQNQIVNQIESVQNIQDENDIQLSNKTDQAENGYIESSNNQKDNQSFISEQRPQNKLDFHSQPEVDLSGLNKESIIEQDPKQLTIREKAKMRYRNIRLDPQRKLHQHIFISMYELFHAKEKYAQGYWKQYALLQLRNYKHLYRSPILPIRFAITYTIEAFFCGSLFWRISHNIEKIQTLIGALYFMQMIVSFPLSSEAASQIFRHRQEFLRDHASGTYGTAPWFISLIVTDLPIYIGAIFHFTIIGYYLVGFNDNFGRYMMFLVAMIFLGYSVVSYAIFWTCATRSLTSSHVFLMSTLSILMTFSGGFIAMGEIPSYWKWMPWVSVFSYAFKALMYTVFYGANITCGSDMTVCPDVLEKFGLGGFSLVGAYLMGLAFMAGWIAIFMVLSYFFIRYKRYQ